MAEEGDKMNKIKNWGIIIGFVIIGVLYVYTKIQARTIQIWRDKVITLDEHLNKQVVISRGLLLEKTRDKEGKIVVRRRFVPPESKITITTERLEETGDDGITAVRIRTRGLAFSPGIAVAYIKTPLVMFSSKLFFWSRWGVIMNVNEKSFGFGISRYIDDAFFIWHPRNLEAFWSYHPVKFVTDAPRWYVGLRITL